MKPKKEHRAQDEHKCEEEGEVVPYLESGPFNGPPAETYAAPSQTGEMGEAVALVLALTALSSVVLILAGRLEARGA